MSIGFTKHQGLLSMTWGPSLGACGSTRARPQQFTAIIAQVCCLLNGIENILKSNGRCSLSILLYCTVHFRQVVNVLDSYTLFMNPFSIQVCFLPFCVYRNSLWISISFSIVSFLRSDLGHKSHSFPIQIYSVSSQLLVSQYQCIYSSWDYGLLSILSPFSMDVFHEENPSLCVLRVPVLKFFSSQDYFANLIRKSQCLILSVSYRTFEDSNCHEDEYLHIHSQHSPQF